MKVIDYRSVINTMQDDMRTAAEDDNTLERTLFHSAQAISTGIAGVLQALHAINENIIEISNREKNA